MSLLLIMGPIAFGIKCLLMILDVLAPNVREANTYSWSFNERTCPRTIRAILTQPVIDIARIIVPTLEPRTTISKITSNK